MTRNSSSTEISYTEKHLLSLAHGASWPSDAAGSVLVASARDCGTDWVLGFTGREDWIVHH